MFYAGEKKRMEMHFVRWFYSTRYTSGWDARSAIHNAQIKLDIPEICRITTDEEWEYAEEIIEYIRDTALHDYFNEELYIPKLKFRGIWEEQCFMFWLQTHMQKHECDSHFLGRDLHAKTLDYKSYGSWGGSLSDATYELTDFALVMQKLHYIAYVHNKFDKKLNPKGTLNNNEKGIEDIIRTRTISVSRY